MDEKLIEEAFVNIILNALDAMEEGGILRISACSKKGKIVVEFSDTGKGIAQEDMNKVFDPFFTTKEDGVGLGL